MESFIKSNIEQLKLSKILATIKLDVEIPEKLEDLVKYKSKKDELIKIIENLNAKFILKNENLEKNSRFARLQ